MQLIMGIVFLSAQTGSSIYKDDKGRALNGYDVVGFFKDNKPVKGADKYSYTYENATWLFSNQENLEAFKANPKAFIPQYGGYCAYGVAKDHKSPTEAEAFKVDNGKLYFNYNLKVKKLWEANQAQFINTADSNWLLIKDKE